MLFGAFMNMPAKIACDGKHPFKIIKLFYKLIHISVLKALLHTKFHQDTLTRHGKITKCGSKLGTVQHYALSVKWTQT